MTTKRYITQTINIRGYTKYLILDTTRPIQSFFGGKLNDTFVLVCKTHLVEHRDMLLDLLNGQEENSGE